MPLQLFGRRTYHHRTGGRFDGHRHYTVTHRRRLASQGLGERADAGHQRQHERQHMPVDFGTVADGIHIGGAGAQRLIGDDAPLGGQPGLFGHGNARPQADGRQHHVGLDADTIGQLGHQTTGQPLAGILIMHRLGQRPQVEAHPQPFQPPLHRRGRGFRQKFGQTAPQRLHQRDAEAAIGQVIGKFAADQPAAQHRHGLFAVQRLTQPAVVHQVIDGKHLTRRVTLQRRRPGIRAQGQHQLAVVQMVVGQQHALPGGVETGDPNLRAHFDVELLGNLLDAGHGQFIGGFFLGEAGRQHGLGIGAAIVGGEHDHRRFLVQLAEFLERVETGQAGTDDDDGIHGQILGRVFGRLRFPPFQNLPCQRRNPGRPSHRESLPRVYRGRCLLPATLLLHRR